MLARFGFNHTVSSVHAAAIIIGGAALASRLLGILRDRLLASAFGAGRELDIYYAAFEIPDFMSVIFLLGAGSAAILPVFQEYLYRDREDAWRLISGLVFFFCMGAVILLTAALVLAPQLVALIVPGFDLQDQEQTVLLTRLMLASPLLLGLSGIFSSIAQSYQRFLAFSLAPVMYNVGIIAGIVFFVPLIGLEGLAWGVIVGAFLHLATQVVAAWGVGFRLYLGRGFMIQGVLRVAKLSFPRVLSLSLSHLTLLALVALGSTLTAGSIAVFQLSRNLYFVPVGLFGISYSVVIFPRLNKSYLERDAASFFRDLYFGIRMVLLWLVPSAALFLVLRAHIVRSALGAGSFSWEDTRLTAAALAVFVFAMIGGGLLPLLIKAFYAIERTWAPFFITIGSSVLTVIIALWLTGVLSADESFLRNLVADVFRVADLPSVAVLGLPIGFAAGMFVNAWFLSASLLKTAANIFGGRPKFPVSAVFKIIIASIIAGVVAYAVRVSFSETIPLITFARVLFQGAAAGAAGVGVYIGVLMLLKSEDIASLRRSMEKRLWQTGILPKSWDPGEPME